MRTLAWESQSIALYTEIATPVTRSLVRNDTNLMVLLPKGGEGIADFRQTKKPPLPKGGKELPILGNSRGDTKRGQGTAELSPRPRCANSYTYMIVLVSVSSYFSSTTAPGVLIAVCMSF